MNRLCALRVINHVSLGTFSWTVLASSCISDQESRQLWFVPSWVLVTDASAWKGIYAMIFTPTIYINHLVFPPSGINLSIVASFPQFQVLVEEIVGPSRGLKDLIWSTRLHLTILPFSFLKKKLILIQITGRTLFQKYISMNLQLIGLVFAMLWTWMRVLEGKQKLVWDLYAKLIKLIDCISCYNDMPFEMSNFHFSACILFDT